jgi:hypothetical protein
MDIHKEYEEQIAKKKEFRFTIGKRICLILFDFSNPIKKDMFNGTEYIFYDCLIKFKQKENQEYPEDVPHGKHIIQIPASTCWIQLYQYFKRNKLLSKKNIKIDIMKRNNFDYTFLYSTTK